MSDSLAGTVVVVTGAGGRLGQRMAEGFAARGATLAAVGRDAARTPFPAGAAGRAFGADMTDEEAVTDLFVEVTETLGAPGAVIHTVGTWAGQSLLDTGLADFRKLVDLNLTSAFLCFREAARHMRGGRLIAFASAQGADRGRAEQYGYSAAKAGVVRLVEAAAEEFDGTGLTVHAIAPSTILYEEDGEGVEAADLVDLALYLCTDAGSALNGATLRAYG